MLLRHAVAADFRLLPLLLLRRRRPMPRCHLRHADV